MKAYKRYISLFLFGIGISCQSLQDLEAQKHTGRALGTTYSIQYLGSATDYENNQKAFDSIFQIALSLGTISVHLTSFVFNIIVVYIHHLYGNC